MAGDKAAVADVIGQEIRKTARSGKSGYRVITGDNGVGELDVIRVDPRVDHADLTPAPLKPAL